MQASGAPGRSCAAPRPPRAAGHGDVSGDLNGHVASGQRKVVPAQLGGLEEPELHARHRQQEDLFRASRRICFAMSCREEIYA